ncbi:MAG: glutaredoxin [Clostridiales bacterium]|nr:glutaredoxin [Clostridiales bacterium]
MLKVYGSPLCPDCRELRVNFDANGVEYEYVDVTASMRNLKAFLAERDARSEFAPAKAIGAVGIPAIFTEDGAVTLDWEGYLAKRGLPVVYKENGPACGIDGKGC